MASKARDSTSGGKRDGTGGARSGRTQPTRKAPAAKRRVRGGSGRIGPVSMIGVAAIGLAAGLVANLGRKAAVQAPSALAGDWLEALKGEHKAALALFDAIQATRDTQTVRRAVLLSQLKHALAKHAFTEENVIYPALRDADRGSDADRLNHEHGYVKQRLYDLDAMAKDSLEFLPLVAKFRAELDRHIREEEEDILPALHRALGEEKNHAITRAANREGFKVA